jgi:large repetitive protein
MFNSSLRTIEAASEDLLRAVESKGRTIIYALPGSEELRYLDSMGANANVGGPTMADILLRQNPTKVEVLEEFLHGTQARLGIIEKVGVCGAETHVKEFMLRHQRLLGISPEDARILQQILGI